MNTVSYLEILDEDERDHLNALPIYITVLIASADGKIDEVEMKKAVALSETELTYSQDVMNFYRQACVDFEDKLKLVIASLPTSLEERQKFLLKQIIKVNTILKKIDSSYATELYESFKRLARSIASASGGILGFGKIGFEESRLIDLHMIENPSL